MTGFGTGRATMGNEELSVEVRSLNHKFCEIKVRLPRELGSLEPHVLKKVRNALTRGAVEVSIKRQTGGMPATTPIVDLALARQYRQAFAAIAEDLALDDRPSIADIFGQPGVVKLGEPMVDADSAARAVDEALEQALDRLSKMRQEEGIAIRADLGMRLQLVRTLAGEVGALAYQAVQEYRHRLAERVQELAAGMPIDQQRLAQEVAFFAERTDIAEEMARLESHLKQFQGLLESPEAAGRRMDFVVQEMHREVNTTGAKSQHPEISARVLTLKAELERIREQVQNVE